MTAANHDVHFEDVMALLDGELAAAEVERVRAHLAGCPQCQQVASHVEDVSQRLTAWEVTSAPASMTPPRTGVSRRLYRRWLPMAAAVGLATTAGFWVMSDRRSPDRSTPEALMETAVLQVGGAEPAESLGQSRVTAETALALQERQPQRSKTGPRIARTARLALVAADVESTRTKIEQIVTGAGGYIDRITASNGDGRGPSVSATFRIPTDRLPQTLTAIKALGRVTLERQEGEEVTQQSTDLDARLANARTSEARLRRLLEDRTGTVTQVLEVEREITRVRGEIERMEAERKSLDARIDYAILSLDVYEERKAAVDLGPLPLSARFRDALVDGWSGLLTVVVGIALIAVQLLPTIIAVAMIASPIAWFGRRRRT